MLEIASDNVQVVALKAEIPVQRDGDFSIAKSNAENSLVNLGGQGDRLGWIAALRERAYDRMLTHVRRRPPEMYSWPAGTYGATLELAGQSEAFAVQYRQTRAGLEEPLRSEPGNHWLHRDLAIVLAGLEEAELARAEARRAMELMPRSRDVLEGLWLELDLAQWVFNPLGDFDTVIDLLDAYLSRPGQWSIERLEPLPSFDAIRDDPRFQTLVQRHRRQ